MGFISKFILPKEVDFDNALQQQAHVMRTIVDVLLNACAENEVAALGEITGLADEVRNIKTRNMKDLLDVFITTYDKESIYRIITQLDWVSLSVKHFKLEVENYGIDSLHEYQTIVEGLVDMAVLLELGITRLATRNPKAIAPDIDNIRDKYDYVVTLCAQTLTGLFRENSDDGGYVFIQRELLMQLKEIAKRIYVAANTLEDMAIKVI